MISRIARVGRVARAGGGVGVFNPLSVSPSAWYDASQETPVADGNPILPQDWSGNGRHQTQASGTLQPLYKTAIQNGRPIFRYDGTDDVTQAVFTFNPPYTKLLVAKLRGTVAANQYMVDGVGVNNGAIFCGVASSNASAYQGAALSIGALGTTDFWRIAVVFNGASSKTFLGAGAPTSGNTGAGVTGAGVTLGANGDANLQWAQADIAEALFVPSVLSDAVIASWGAYVKAKWGLVA